MNKSKYLLVLLVYVICFFGIINLRAESKIIPKNWWNDPSLLEQAEHPIQTQLDTGIGMNATAWDMANVKDARLFIIYVSLFQSLDKAGQKELFKEQSDWLQVRKEALAKLDDPSGGSAVTLDKACKHINMTDLRIQELQQRLKN